MESVRREEGSLGRKVEIAVRPTYTDKLTLRGNLPAKKIENRSTFAEVMIKRRAIFASAERCRCMRAMMSQSDAEGSKPRSNWRRISMVTGSQSTVYPWSQRCHYTSELMRSISGERRLTTSGVKQPCPGSTRRK